MQMKLPREKLQEKIQLIWEDKRLETFQNWPIGDDKPCSAAKLAEAGFYFTGSSSDPDAVQCFLCDKALDGWDEQDDPWAEHVSHSEKCEFAQLRQPVAALTFQQFLNFKIQLVTKEYVKATEEAAQNLDDLYDARLHKLKKVLRSLKSKMIV